MRKPRLIGEGNSHYHVVSRIAGRSLLFGDAEKAVMLKLLRRQARFTGVEVLAWCLMGNHFHLLLEVPDRAVAMEGWTRDDYLDRLKRLLPERGTKERLEEIGMWRKAGNTRALRNAAAAVEARLFDLSAFMREFKQKFSVWFNRRHGRVGTLWEDRFRSVLIEGRSGAPGDLRGSTVMGPCALRAVAAYIDLNPLRAGIVLRPEDYHWCSYASALAGDALSRRGLAKVTGRRKWTGGASGAQAEYRVLLYVEGVERSAGDGPDGGTGTPARRGVRRDEAERVMAEGGRLSLAEVLRHRVRHFSHGGAIGSREFLEGVFERRRDWFGPNRKTGARRMRGADWEGLMALRDLRDTPGSG